MLRKKEIKKIEVKKEEFHLDDYKTELKMLDSFCKLIKNYQKNEIVGFTQYGTPLHEIVSIEKLISRYKLQNLLKILKKGE